MGPSEIQELLHKTDLQSKTKVSYKCKMGKRKSRNEYAKKRKKFHGNQHIRLQEERVTQLVTLPGSQSSVNDDESENTLRPSQSPSCSVVKEESPKCSSAKNVSLIADEEDTDDYFVLLNLLKFKNVIEELGRCPECAGQTLSENDLKIGKGLPVNLPSSAYHATGMGIFFHLSQLKKLEALYRLKEVHSM